MEKLTLPHSPELSSAFWQNFVLPVLRHKRMTYTFVATSVAVTLIIALLIPNQYTSTATLLPTASNDQISELKDLAAGSLGDLGLGALKQPSDQSSALYPQILTGRTISEDILSRTYRFDDDGRPKSLTMAEYVDEPNIDLSLRALNDLVAVSVDRRTGLVWLSVTTKYPELSAAVVHAYLEELNDYNINKRQSQAKSNERFMAERLTQIKKELSNAEDSLLAFKEQNRNFGTSSDPELQLQLGRLERDVLIQSEQATLMTRQHEMARIDAVKDVPVVNVLDSGSVSVLKSWPHRSVYLLTSLLVSLFGGILLSLWLDISSKRRFREQFEQTVQHSDVHFNRIETKVINRVARLAGTGSVVESARPAAESESRRL